MTNERVKPQTPDLPQTHPGHDTAWASYWQEKSRWQDQEIDRLQGEAEVANEQLAQLRGFAEAHKTCRGSDEPGVVLVWGLESKAPGGDWTTYWTLYSDRARAETAAKNGRPLDTEWRVVTYTRVAEPASREASSADPLASVRWVCPRCQTSNSNDHEVCPICRPAVKSSDGA